MLRIADLILDVVMPDQINEILRNRVKEKLSRGEVVASMTVRLVRGVEIARIAKTAGFDSLYVDMEHSSFSLESTGQICIAALETGITPLVRVPRRLQPCRFSALAVVLQPLADDALHADSSWHKTAGGIEIAPIVGKQIDVLAGQGLTEHVDDAPANAAPSVRGLGPDVDDVGVAHAVG